jgi:hypothetical protein
LGDRAAEKHFERGISAAALRVKEAWEWWSPSPLDYGLYRFPRRFRLVF